MAREGLFEEIYALVEQIPPGKVVTYGQIATMLGNPRLARRVGQAMYGAPRGRSLPCHRVVHADGSLCEGAFDGEHRLLLEAEGVGFRSGNRVDLARYRWDGAFINGSIVNGSIARGG